jgi:hypothetical protein
MLKHETHFEQVPLEVVKKIVEEEAKQEKTSEQARGTKKKKLEEDPGKIMTVPFDIFQAESDGSVLWLESAATLEDAKARIQQLAVRSPGEYLLVNQETGNKLVIKLEGLAGAAGC